MDKKIHFKEFKYNEIEIHEYLQMPRILLTNEYFKKLSVDAIVLYTLLLDTYKLSTKNGWRDEDRKVYIKFSISRIEELIRCKTNKAISLLRELDDEHGIGLIHIKKQKQGLPNLIYVNNFNNKELFSVKSLLDYEDKDLNNLESTRKKQPLGKSDYLENQRGVLGKSNQGLLGKSNPSKNEYISNNNSKNEYISDDPTPYKEIIQYLNKKTNKSYKFSAYQNRKLIKARWNEGYTFEDFKKVIDNKTNEWIDDQKMNKFLRPTTLFGNKFDQYLNETRSKKSNKSKGDLGEFNSYADNYIPSDEYRDKVLRDLNE